jgi:carboxymethylenebutenolidase
MTRSEVIAGEWMNTPRAGGHSVPTYVARPLGGSFPGVVLLHHRGGLDQGTRECAYRIATQGHIVVTPDLHAIDAAGLSCRAAAAHVQSLGGVADSTMLAIVASGQQMLSAFSGWSGRSAVLGFCSGGRQAYVAAAALAFDAAVVCYGGRIVATADDLSERHPVSPLSMTDKVGCPVLMISGERDKNPSPEQAAVIKSELLRLRKECELTIYPGAGHAFLDAYRDTYSAVNARPAWDRIFGFLGTRLH